MFYEADSDLKKGLFHMFDGMDDTMILSCLQGHMGKAWVNDIKNPKVVQIVVGVFVFFAGDASSDVAEEMLYNLPKYSLVIVKSNEWKKCIEEVHKGRVEKVKRYSFEKSSRYLEEERLKKFLKKLPDGYELKKIDSYLAYSKSLQDLSLDITSQYSSIEDYIKKGIGYCILHHDKIVSVASSYSVYDDGIEIEVDTHPDYVRRGFATRVCASLILDCLSRNKYPSWDAANLPSVALAKKLGYIFKEDYDTYCIDLRRI